MLHQESNPGPLALAVDHRRLLLHVQQHDHFTPVAHACWVIQGHRSRGGWGGFGLPTFLAAKYCEYRLF